MASPFWNSFIICAINIMYVPINKQRINCRKCFGVISRSLSGEKLEDFPQFRRLRSQYNFFAANCELIGSIPAIYSAHHSIFFNFTDPAILSTSVWPSNN